MKKVLILLTFILTISLGFNLYYINNTKSSINDITLQCKKAIKWDITNKISSSSLYWLYDETFKFIDKWEETYRDFENIKYWKCDLLDNTKNRVLCNFVKNKDIKWLNNSTKEWAFENILIRSFIEKKDNCSLLKDISKKEECSINFNNFINLDKINNKNYIGLSIIEVWKKINKIWKDNFVNNLNKEFLEKCVKL